MLRFLSGETVAGRILRGASAGLLVCALALAVGAFRAAIVLLSGRRLAPLSQADVAPLLYYAGGFTAAGITISLLWPFLRGKVAQYMAFALGGMILMLAILASDGGLRSHDAIDFAAVLTMGALFGFAGAYGFLR